MMKLGFQALRVLRHIVAAVDETEKLLVYLAEFGINVTEGVLDADL